MIRPFSLLVKPAGADCNMSCPYCFYRNNPVSGGRKARMDAALAKRIVSSYLELPFPEHHVAFHGGEPLLAGEEFFRRVDNRALINLSYGTRCEAQRRLEFLRDRRENTELWKLRASLELHSILMLFYFDLAAAQENAPGTPEPSSETLRRVKHYLDQNYREQVSLKDAAAFANLSPSYLSRRFHREYGIGFSAYLTARRLEAARHLLRDTKCQIEEVALRCGFSSGTYFIKVFRRHCGATPRGVKKS